MSGNALKIVIPIALAVAAAAAAYFSGGLTIGPTVMLAAELGLAAGVVIDSFVFKSKMVTTNNAPAFQFAAAQEGAPVTVIFGTTRIAGNFIRFNPDLTSQTAITQKAGGKGGSLGGGSQAQTVGYRYATPSEYGLCAGPIDGVGEVYTSPNTNKVRDLGQTVLGAGSVSGVVGTNTIEGAGSSFLSTVKQGGIIRIGTVYTYDTTSTAYTVLKVISDTEIQTYEAIAEDFTAYPYTLRNVIIEITPFTGDYLDLALSGTADEGGTCRLYQGNATQNRHNDGTDPWADGDTVMNYRHNSFAVFLSGYGVGQQPSMNTYQFELQRMPKCYDADGNVIADMLTRGSSDPNNICYQDANPAAILYEILTDKIWGMRIDPGDLDIDSFISASEACARDNIGMSFPIDSAQGFGDVIQTIQQHCQVTIFDTLTSIKCKYLWDTKGDAYQIKARLTKSSIKSFQHTRKAWGTQVNEIRGQFVNRVNYYAVEVVNVQDLASIQVAQTRRASQINFIGFSNSDIAQRMIYRALQQASYSQAAIQGTMNRWDAYLEQYDLFELYWDDWAGNPYTSFYRIVSMEFDDGDADEIKFVAIEDAGYLPTTDNPPTFEEPTFPYLNMAPVSDLQRNLTPPSSGNVPSIAPVLGLELNCYVSPLNPRAAIAFERLSNDISGAQIAWSILAANDFTTLGTAAAFSVTGLLVNAYPVTRAFDRQNALTVSLTAASDLATILAANSVIAAADSFGALTSSTKCLLVIGQEIMQIGYAQSVGGNVVITNVARGRYGTPIQAHAVGAQFWFIPTFDLTNYTELLTGLQSEAANGAPAVEFQAIGKSNNSPSENSLQFFINPDQTVKYLANRPFAPGLKIGASILSGTPGVSTFEVAFKMRPRSILTGAGTNAFAIEAARTGSPLDPSTEFRVQQFDNTGTQIGKNFDSLTPYQNVTDMDQQTSLTGLVEISGYTCQPGCTTLKVFAVVNGWQSIDFLSIPIP